MNIVQLQDMLRGMPDDRLQSEMQTPSGSIPQYLVLSEIVRRDKARSSAAERPKTTVVEDMMNQAQMGGIGSIVGEMPMAPEEGMQEAAPMYADGGFISPADAMGRSGFAGYPQPPQKQPFQLSASPQSGGTMFTPNTNPAPAPQPSFNLNQQPAADNGIQQSANIPSFMQQPNEYSNGYANGGIIGLSGGGSVDPREAFVEMMMPHALRVSERTGVDPRIIIAQAALESGWGRSAPGGNYFGIKSHGKEGGQRLKTKEVGPGGEYQTVDSFRQYDDVAQSADDYGNFLLENPRYKPMLGAKGFEAQIEELGKSGYATDPEYANKIRSIASNSFVQRVMEPSPAPVVAQNNTQTPEYKGDEMRFRPAPAPAKAPVVMAGRETTAGLGEGAGTTAVGTPTDVAEKPKRGLLSGIRSLFEGGDRGKRLGSGLRDVGKSMAEGQQAPEAPDAPMKAADISGLDRLRSSPEEELAKFAALRQQYITGAYADGGFLSALGSGMMDIGSSMARGQEAPEAPDAPMKSGDVSGLDRLRSSPEEELAQYAALRKDYMTNNYADGGTIRMRDGTPEDWNWDQAYQAAQDAARVGIGSGFGGDYVTAGISSLVGPETFEEELAAQQEGTEAARQRLGGYSFIPEYLLPGAAAIKGLKYAAPAIKYAFTNPTARSLLTRAGLVGGTGYVLAGGEPAEPTTPAEPAPEFGYNPAGDTMLPGATEAAQVYELDPKLKERILRQRGPLNGDARTPEEAEAIAANSAPSPYQLLAGSQERQQKMLQEYYDSLIQLERDRMNESQGFGAFLQELGRGMLSNTSALGPSLAAGASRAIGTREDTASNARTRMSELELAKRKAQIEGLAALDKLRYDQLVGGGLSSREKAQYGLTSLLAALKAAQDPISGDPELAKAIQAQLAETMSELGMGYEVPNAATQVEAEPESVFQTILGNI